MDLGQVYTNAKVAEFMVSLFSLGYDATILDPCFGEGAFLKALHEKSGYTVYGCEIDKKLYGKVSADFPEYKLSNEDFLQISPDMLFDGIIMNPPYVRHERIDEMSPIGIEKRILTKNCLFKELPGTANLYMYFIIKAISLLRENGELIVIFPGSWRQARSGDEFKNALYQKCSIEREIHISGNVFEKKALVDVIILKLRKCIDRMCMDRTGAEPEYIKLTEGEFVENGVYRKEFPIDFKEPFFSIGKVRRGLTTGYNRFFINPDLEHKESVCRSIISSPKQVTGYSAGNAATDTLLAVDGPVSPDSELAMYIQRWEEMIVKEKKPQTIYRKIVGKAAWYQLNLFDCKGIIFSYFVRKDMKFVMNKSENLIRDNFYIIYPKIDQWLCFGLLNNLYTYYQLEQAGKRYGAGLLKLQRYDIENLTFPSLDEISIRDKEKIMECAKALAENNNADYVMEITKMVSKYSVLSFDAVNKAYRRMVTDRLEVS